MIYKIRRPDGMFSTGGAWPTFNKTGKVWVKLCNLNSHLALLKGRNRLDKYSDCEIVEFELNEIDKKDIELDEKRSDDSVPQSYLTL
jgi:hypothetical protein